MSLKIAPENSWWAVCWTIPNRDRRGTGTLGQEGYGYLSTPSPHRERIEYNPGRAPLVEEYTVSEAKPELGG